jgi:glycosyltransferase involved in cell wall biosynthesis
MASIGWISDFNLTHSPGGAQRSNAILIEKGRKLGHIITEINFDSPLLENDSFSEFDILLSSNLEFFSQKYQNIIEKINKHSFHVRLEHDMNRYLTDEARSKLVGNCKAFFGLSKFHINLLEFHYGNIFKNVYVVYDPIDTELFKDNKQPRQEKILYAGFMHNFKGTHDFFNFVLQNQDKQFVVAGWGEPVYDFLARKCPNVEFLGIVDYAKMPELFNTYKHFYYAPVIPEPFCRSVAEAALCGCQILTTSNPPIGCLREMTDVGFDAFRDACGQADSVFWKTIDRIKNQD